MTHRIEIHPLPKGPGVQFLLDGHDIANQLTGYTVRHSGIRPPVVELEMTPHTFEAQLEDAAVELDPGIVDMLVRLGWTPPSVGSLA